MKKLTMTIMVSIALICGSAAVAGMPVPLVDPGPADAPAEQPEVSGLGREALAALPVPAYQCATTLNHAVSVRWKPIPSPGSNFAHYAVYRSTSAFSSISGMTPIGTVSDAGAAAYLDQTPMNGTHYYYAVTSVSTTGDEIKAVEPVGPRTPYDETDLQVVSISRTPRYQRFCAAYTYYDILEPSGFGPYTFSSATGLCGGQNVHTRHWPQSGETMTYTAKIRNRGTNQYSGLVKGTWRLEGTVVKELSKTLSLGPGETDTFTYVHNWDNQPRDLSFAMDVSDARLGNNHLMSNTMSVAFLSYIDSSYIENFRESTPQYANPSTNDAIDWLNGHMARFNQLFEDANCAKRVHYDVLEVLDDWDPDPAVDKLLFAIFPFRFKKTTCNYRSCSGWYSSDDDIDYGLIHELAHQLGLVDLYRWNFGPDKNLVSGLGYSGPDGLMNSCRPYLSEHSALAMSHWLYAAHGYYGQYLYCMPKLIKLRILGRDGRPLVGATVQMYQYCERPGQGRLITTQLKAQGTTDSAGIFALPNVPIDRSKVPVTGIGDRLDANPFGYVAVIGTNAVLHFKIQYDGAVVYDWLDITEANIAYWKGQTDTAIFDRQTSLGGPVSHCPPRDMTELNAWDWSAWAQQSAPENSCVEDDTQTKLVGASSMKFTTDGGFDTYVRYPKTHKAKWNLTSATALGISFYAYNPNMGFQSGSPWIRLKDAENNYLEYQYYRNGSPYDFLNEARGVWRTCQIPLDASPYTQNGWRRTPYGTLDFSSVQYLEIHADTWEYGFELWLDGVGFDLPDHYYCDLHRDGIVNAKDFSVLASHWLEGECTPAACGCADIDQNTEVNWRDLTQFAENWLARGKTPRR